MNTATITAGTRVYRWHDTGAFGASPQALTVVRVNRVTVTVRTDSGSTFRIAPDLVYPLPADEDPANDGARLHV